MDTLPDRVIQRQVHKFPEGNALWVIQNPGGRGSGGTCHWCVASSGLSNRRSFPVRRCSVWRQRARMRLPGLQRLALVHISRDQDRNTFFLKPFQHFPEFFWIPGRRRWSARATGQTGLVDQRAT